MFLRAALLLLSLVLSSIGLCANVPLSQHSIDGSVYLQEAEALKDEILQTETAETAPKRAHELAREFTALSSELVQQMKLPFAERDSGKILGMQKRMGTLLHANYLVLMSGFSDFFSAIDRMKQSFSRSKWGYAYYKQLIAKYPLLFTVAGASSATAIAARFMEYPVIRTVACMVMIPSLALCTIKHFKEFDQYRSPEQQVDDRRSAVRKVFSSVFQRAMENEMIGDLRVYYASLTGLERDHVLPKFIHAPDAFLMLPPPKPQPQNECNEILAQEVVEEAIKEVPAKKKKRFFFF